MIGWPALVETDLEARIRLVVAWANSAVQVPGLQCVIDHVANMIQ